MKKVNAASLTERHQFMLNKLQAEGKLNNVLLGAELQVSAVTIRKDLIQLEEKGLLFRTHGGATQNNPYTVDRPVNEKEKIHFAEKDRIGAAAAKMVNNGDSIIIASGTSMLALARNLQTATNITVVTSALNVAIELNNNPNIEILQLGGLLRHSSSSVMGAYAEHILTDFFCSTLFLGVDGIDIEFGITTANAMEAQLNKKMIKAAQKTVVLTDSSKFGRKGFGRICNLDEIDHIITDTGITDFAVNALEGAGVKITIV